MLITIDGVLTGEELREIRAQLAGAPWSTGLSAGPQAAAVKRNEQLPETWPGLKALRLQVMHTLNRSATLMSAALPLKVLPPNFNRYTVDHSHYGLHTDNALRLLPDGSYLRTDLSATLFLSPPETYDGGELTIDDAFGRRAVKLASGSLVVYPASSIHEVTPVTRGERLACYLFIQSLVRDAEQRRLLFEMDTALIQLRAQHGETQAEVVRLTGVYHNLLRQWGDC